MILKSDIDISAYAKINLYLDITGRRSDGYHLLETIMQTVSLCDEISISLPKSGEIVLYADNDFSDDVPTDNRNIAYKAAKVFYDTVPELFSGAEIHLRKHIPSQAGLGGGSADAAAVLRGLYKLHNKPFDIKKLFDAALSLGADVPFCLAGGAAVCHGVGEVITPITPMPQDISIVIAKGGEGISTGKAFSEIDRLGFAEEQTEHLLEMYDNQDYKKLCFNRFEQVTNIGEIKDIREKMLGYGAEAACLSGSGSAVFGLFRDKYRAGNCAEELRKNGFFSEVCKAVK